MNYSNKGQVKLALLRAGRAAAYVLIAAMLSTTAGPMGAQAQQRENYSGAIHLLEQKLADRERSLEQEHPFTLTTMYSLATMYKAQGNYSEAERLYKRALEASERALGKEHPVTLASANGLASLYRAQGRYREAGQAQ